jgi:hypothetical protein
MEIEYDELECTSLLSFSPTASVDVAMGGEANDYGLITIPAVRAIAQRLHIDLLLMIWHVILGYLGKGE